MAYFYCPLCGIQVSGKDGSAPKCAHGPMEQSQPTTTGAKSKVTYIYPGGTK